MKVLWITNLIMPPVAEDLGMKIPPICGWMYSSLKRLVRMAPDMEIAVASLYDGNEIYDKTLGGVRYFCLPSKGADPTKRMPHVRALWKSVAESFNPDVVHIHGSEFTPGYEWCDVNGVDNVVMSIQGLLCGYERHLLGSVKGKDLNILTFRDIIKRDGFKDMPRDWHRRAEEEKRFISGLRHVIGRTDWDRCQVWALNPEITYHYGGETLRDAFYTNRWEYDKCEPHTIFLSQASSPLKGADMVFRALPLVLREFPDARIRIAGFDIANVPWYRRNSYSEYMMRLLKKLGISDRVSFLGLLSEKEMCDEYLKANVFVCSSSIENSPNSLGEAQMLRMPHLASVAGGTPEITGMNRDVLYRFEEYEMLAEKICAVFRQGKDFVPHNFDESRYDGELNTRLLIETYDKIASEATPKH